MKKLLDMDWSALWDIAKATIASAGLYLIVLGLINWRRHKPEDAAKARKTLAEEKKALAEAEEIEERAAALKLQRDEKIFDIQAKLADKLYQDNEQTKKKLDETIEELHAVREDLQKANRRCGELEEMLLKERENNKICATEVEQLKVQLEILKRDNDRNKGPI